MIAPSPSPEGLPDNPYSEGGNAYLDGKKFTDNPYTESFQNIQALEWAKGYQDTKAEFEEVKDDGK